MDIQSFLGSRSGSHQKDQAAEDITEPRIRAVLPRTRWTVKLKKSPMPPKCWQHLRANCPYLLHLVCPAFGRGLRVGVCAATRNFKRFLRHTLLILQTCLHPCNEMWPYLQRNHSGTTVNLFTLVHGFIF